MLELKQRAERSCDAGSGRLIHREQLHLKDMSYAPEARKSLRGEAIFEALLECRLAWLEIFKTIAPERPRGCTTGVDAVLEAEHFAKR